ncbi:MAG TPA: homocysteine S-methyltransferase family protein [Planctomycetota bacterium]|nr:homocysteine S-methyltransferase family protein [Planctomycetota bacterium]
MAPFLDALRDRVVIGDGAMGTELLKRGVPLGSPLGELNLSRPDWVKGVHREYAEAGAELHRTNTFTANRVRLRASGLESATREINLAGARLAREASGGRAHVLGSVGPLSDLGGAAEDVRRAFEEQCRALAEGGCDGLILETFTEFADLRQAVAAARTTGLPVVAQVALKEGKAKGVEEVAADVIGINCMDPEEAERAIRSVRGALLSTFPSAGPPQDGRYPVSPDQFEARVGRWVELGVRLVGGCCGTTPAHIRALAKGMGR